MQENVAWLKDAGVVGKQAKHHADEEKLQVVAVVARLRERVVQARNTLGRLDVDRVLVAEGAPLHPDDEAEFFNVLRQVGEGKARLFAAGASTNFVPRKAHDDRLRTD